MGASTGVNNGPGILQESAAETRKTPTETVQRKKVERCAEMKRGEQMRAVYQDRAEIVVYAARLLLSYVVHVLICVIIWKINWLDGKFIYFCN